jgi:serine carboxypeptidase-like clade 2
VWLSHLSTHAAQANPYAWNKVAHVLFVESPAFVGFSYSRRQQDRIVGDARTAADMRRFLLGFLEVTSGQKGKFI